MVSIIIPVFNASENLSQCLNSVATQSYKNIEIICIDDQSTDDSWEKLLKHATKDSRVKPHKLETNSGAGAARDFGLKAASGQFVMFVDADDYIDGSHVQMYINELDSSTDIVLGGYFLNKNRKESLISSPNSPYTPWLRTSPCIRLYKTEFLRSHQIDFRGSRYYEDIVFNYRCMVENPTIKVTTYAGYHYLVSESSITQIKSDTRINFETNVNNHRAFWEEIKFQNISNDMLEIIEYVFIQNITIGMIYNIRRSSTNCYKLFRRLRKSLFDDIFPNYQKNKYIGINKLPEEFADIRFVLSVYMAFEKLGIDRAFLKLLSFGAALAKPDKS